jgi:carotenoid cleavage dioxygenase-like enzyme
MGLSLAVFLSIPEGDSQHLAAAMNMAAPTPPKTAPKPTPPKTQASKQPAKVWELKQGTQHPLLSHVHGLGSHVQGLSSHVQGLSSHVKGLNSHVEGLSSHVQGLSSHVHELGSHAHQFGSHVHQFGSNIHQFLQPPLQAGQHTAEMESPPAKFLQPPVKGELPAHHPRVREAARLGTNEYSHEDWSKALHQLETISQGVRTHKEFAQECKVEGTIPMDLDGTLFRNGPGKYERGGTQYEHMLDGDGLVVSWDINPATNTVFTRARFVRTKEFEEEEEADQVLYRGTFGTQKPGGLLKNAFDVRTKNLANTNVVYWGGRLHALYEAGVPYELDPSTLSTLCVDDMEGCIPRTEGLFVSTAVDVIDQLGGLGGWAFTAHPHMDPNTNHLCGWAWQSLSGSKTIVVRFAEWDADWNRVASRSHALTDCSSAPHDYGVTKKNYVMVQNRLDVDPLPYVLGQKGAAKSLVSRPDLPVLVHVVPRNPNVSAVILEGPKASFEIHVAFAHDGPPIGTPASSDDPDADDHIVTFYSAGWDRLAEGTFLSEWGADGELAPDFNNIPRTLLWRYVVDTRTGSVKRTVAPGSQDLCIDHPHVNPRFEGSPACRYVYAIVTNEKAEAGPPRGYVRMDLLTGKRDIWYAPSGRVFVEEPVIVEKESARGNPRDEADVWLLGSSQDMDDEGRTSLLIFDGANLSAGPVAKLRTDSHITHGLHGSFAKGFHGLRARL